MDSRTLQEKIQDIYGSGENVQSRVQELLDRDEIITRLASNHADNLHDMDREDVIASIKGCGGRINENDDLPKYDLEQVAMNVFNRMLEGMTTEQIKQNFVGDMQLFDDEE
jgi:hypothetical protein